MTRIALICFLVVLVSCESDNVTETLDNSNEVITTTTDDAVIDTVEQEEEDIELPEANSGELAMYINEDFLTFNSTEILAQNLPQCGMPLMLQIEGTKVNPDGSSLTFNMLVVDAIAGNFDIAEFPWSSCILGSVRTSGVRLSVFYKSPTGAYQEIYLSNPEHGGSGFINILEFEYIVQWAAMEDGYVSANFNVLLNKTTPATGGTESMRLIGAINNIPVAFPGCMGGFC